ncbi:hypothetical protein HanPSC8_Chr10g0436321 [Helianthus annuus]|nr:hypothetical protein HanHA89_Chr10g0393661 [Helianthus annuus]KAJ0884656.1 hypothetical protein HanPSC8_Chr10g0436321 [Helianthus annuus]
MTVVECRCRRWWVLDVRWWMLDVGGGDRLKVVQMVLGGAR